jgi:hypothetical protein
MQSLMRASINSHVLVWHLRGKRQAPAFRQRPSMEVGQVGRLRIYWPFLSVKIRTGQIELRSSGIHGPQTRC